MGFRCFRSRAGRFPLILEATRRLKKEIGESVALYGLITGPLTLAMHLRATISLPTSSTTRRP